MSVDAQMNILLVEDSKLTRVMEVKILKEVGFTHILEADNGEEALQLLKDHDVDLIISDWNMPVMDGYGFLTQVRAQEKWKDTPFVMATAQAEKKQANKAEEAGVTGFISKPFTAEEMRRVIEETFGEKRQAVEKRGVVLTESGKLSLKVAHIQITDHLTLGVSKHMIDNQECAPKHFELETACMPSWNPIQDALEKGTVDAAFILAPIAMDLFSGGAPIKLLLFAHKNGSICVRNKKGYDPGMSLEDFYREKSFYIPHMLSIHHMLSSMFLSEIGLHPGVPGQTGSDVFFEVAPPIKMPEFMAQNPDVAGYTVAEPLGSKAISAGTGELVFLSGEIWENHPCCVVVFREEVVEAHPEAIQEFIDLLVRAGQYIARNPGKSSEIAVSFLDPDHTLGLKAPVLKKVLTERDGIRTDDLFPVVEDLDIIQQYMSRKMGVGTEVDLERFVDTRFAEVACQKAQVTRRASRLLDLATAIPKMVDRWNHQGRSEKDTTHREGKYLTFQLEDEEYGIGILKVKEIIGMQPIRSMPQTPGYVKGVINLRGKVIPVVDLRLRFDMNEFEYTERTCIIVSEIESGQDIVQVGIVVDAVSEVLHITEGEVENSPNFGDKVNNDWILGIAKTEGGVKILLDIDEVFSANEVSGLEAGPVVPGEMSRPQAESRPAVQ